MHRHFRICGKSGLIYKENANFYSIKRATGVSINGEAGFVMEGITRRNVYTSERYYDTIIYGLIRQEQQELSHIRPKEKCQSVMIDF